MASDTLDLGRVRLVHRGAYSASTVYEFFDCVTYNGSSYLCTAAAGSPAGTLPTVTATWALLAQKGDTGAKGTTGAVGQQGVKGIRGYRSHWSDRSPGRDRSQGHVFLS